MTRKRRWRSTRRRQATVQVERGGRAERLGRRRTQDPRARGRQREKSRGSKITIHARGGNPARKPGQGRKSKADRLTVGLPHRQRCLSALTPEHLQGREPASRGAHHSSGHEDTQEAPGAPEAGSKTSRGHLILRACLLQRRTRTPARSPESQSQPQDRHTHAQPGVARDKPLWSRQR